MPEYALQNYYMFVKDKLNPDQGIQAEVEQLKAPAARDEASLAEVCSDPNRNVLDEDVAASDGKINLAGGRVVTSHDYLFAVRNDTLYDQVFVDHVSAPSRQFKIDQKTRDENVLVPKVGSFSDAHTDADNVLDASWNDKMNLTKQSGLVALSTDITIEEAEAGKVLKEPSLVLRFPEGNEVEAGGIQSLTITRKTGTSFNIPARDLVEYIRTETPILLKDVMNVADSGTYTVKMTYDASIVDPGEEVQISLDDLGDRRARDLCDRSLEASTESVTFHWES